MHSGQPAFETRRLAFGTGQGVEKPPSEFLTVMRVFKDRLRSFVTPSEAIFDPIQS